MQDLMPWHLHTFFWELSGCGVQPAVSHRERTRCQAVFDLLEVGIWHILAMNTDGWRARDVWFAAPNPQCRWLANTLQGRTSCTLMWVVMSKHWPKHGDTTLCLVEKVVTRTDYGASVFGSAGGW
jgi:hypothetical protein